MREQCEALEGYFRQFLSTDVPIIDRIFEHLVDGGGKRFRPLLVLLISSVNGRADRENTFRLAVAVEFLHTATLLHDDVVDKSDVRRGHRVAYRIWGAEPSVLSGDYLYSRAINLLVEVGQLRILEVLSGATTAMARGEVLQLLRSYSTSTTQEEYLEVIRGKTASLISASCKAAGYLAGYGAPETEALGRFGMNLGMAFQVVDDVLDYSADRGLFGKAIGKDFLEGKVTLPIIVLMGQLDAGGRGMLADIFLKDSPAENDFTTVLDLMRDRGTLDASMDVADSFSRLAMEEISAVPEGAVRDSLKSLCEYVVRRRW